MKTKIMKIQFDLDDILKACTEASRAMLMYNKDNFNYNAVVRKGANGSFKGVDVYLYDKKSEPILEHVTKITKLQAGIKS